MTKERRWGYLLVMKDMAWSYIATLVPERDGQDSRKDSTVPLWAWSESQQSVSTHIPPLFHGTQWPMSASTLNLPERSLAWVVAFSTSQGEEEQVLNRGWHLVRLRKPVLRYLRYLKEERELALDLSLSCQCYYSLNTFVPKIKHFKVCITEVFKNTSVP